MYPPHLSPCRAFGCPWVQLQIYFQIGKTRKLLQKGQTAAELLTESVTV